MITVPEVTAEMSTLDTALALAARGWHVFPVDHPELAVCAGPHGSGQERAACRQRGKEPASVNFTMAATTEPKMITTWFAGAVRNIGINCGLSRLLVVDEDEPGALARYAAAHGVTVPPTFIVTTGRGQHRYFAAPEDVKVGNHRGALEPYHCDIRAGNAYVVAPGSLHATGVVYAVTDDREPVAAPPWLLAAIQERQAAASMTPNSTWTTITPAPGGLAAVPEVITNGTRHDVLMRYAASLRGRGAPQDEAEVLMRAAWLRCEQPSAAPYAWTEATALLADVYTRYPAGGRAALPGSIRGDQHGGDHGDQRGGGDPGDQHGGDPGDQHGGDPGSITEPPPGHELVEGRTWRPVDLAAVLEGHWQPPEPTVGRRADGRGLFYLGKAHTVVSETEAGKTWFAQSAALDEMHNDHHVLYVDFEDDQGTIAGRLLTLGAPREMIAARFHYVRPESPLGGVHLDDLDEVMRTYRPTLAVIDGITEAMTMHGMNPLDNVDVARFGRLLPRRLAAGGAAAVSLDHVVKDRETRGRYALGGVHKLNALDGAAYLLENRTPFGVGLTGRSTVKIAKDRPGQLRAHTLPSAGGLHWYGDLVLDSKDVDYAEVGVEPPHQRQDTFRPTVLMTKIAELLAEKGPLAQRVICDLVSGKTETKRAALSHLIADGYVSENTPHRLIMPYDPRSQTA